MENSIVQKLKENFKLNDSEINIPVVETYEKLSYEERRNYTFYVELVDVNTGDSIFQMPSSSSYVLAIEAVRGASLISEEYFVHLTMYKDTGYSAVFCSLSRFLKR